MLKRKKQTKSESEADLKRRYDIPVSKKLRWKGLEGVAWYFLSLKVRKEEAEKYGRCVSCPAPLNWNEGDCGHYVAVSRSPGMKLHRSNVALQCRRCNNPRWVPDASIPFAAELDRRYGKGFAAKLYEQSRKYNAPLSKLELERTIELWR